MSCISLSTAALVLSCLRGIVPAGSEVIPPYPPLLITGQQEFCDGLGLAPVTAMPDGLPSWDLDKLTVADFCELPLLS